MKYIITFVLLCGALFANDLPVADQTKPLYQMKWGVMPPGDMWIGGSWERVRIETHKLTPKERAAIEAQATASMYRKAAYLSWVIAGLACVASYLMKAREGIGVALICAVFSFASSFMAQSVHYGLRVGVCGLLLCMVAICFHPKVRDWSISHSKLYKKLFGGRNGRD